ncbi:CBS domain-containing protein [Marinobacterium aestuariivivens]|uniref:CBS domain-containing protein n=1 Tax=Marinobacterium aestuariivivens TaxID=1698799 RepID=A0ABW2A3S1_9GAMM
MTTDRTGAVPLLQQAYLQQYPGEATQLLEKLPADQIGRILGDMPLEPSLPVWERLVPDIAGRVLESLPLPRIRELLSRATPNRCIAWLTGLEPEVRERYLDQLDAGRAGELRLLMSFPPDRAGSLMDPRVLVFRPAMTVREAMRRLRDSRRQDILSLFVLDDDNRLAGFIPIQLLAMSRAADRLDELMQPVRAFVEALAPRDELVERLDEYRLIDLPVIDRDGRLLGVVPPGPGRGRGKRGQRDAADHGRQQQGGAGPVEGVFRRAQAPALAADQSVDGLSGRRGRRSVREHHRPVHRPGGAAAGGCRTVGQHRCPGDGRHDARPGAA